MLSGEIPNVNCERRRFSSPASSSVTSRFNTSGKMIVGRDNAQSAVRWPDSLKNNWIKARINGILNAVSVKQTGRQVRKNQKALSNALKDHFECSLAYD